MVERHRLATLRSDKTWDNLFRRVGRRRVPSHVLRPQQKRCDRGQPIVHLGGDNRRNGISLPALDVGRCQSVQLGRDLGELGTVEKAVLVVGVERGSGSPYLVFRGRQLRLLEIGQRSRRIRSGRRVIIVVLPIFLIL